jgi:lactate dehydrogenase-like 2-hydroxyacid dehydrogenase
VKVVFTDLVFEDREQITLPGIDMEVHPPVERPAGMIAVAKDADVLILRDQFGPLTKEVIDACSNLKLVVTRSAGYDHIDLDAARARGIAVCNVPDYGAHAIAEHAFALLLSVGRNVCRAENRYKQERRFDDTGMAGVELLGKTLGVIGTGRIGRHSVRIGKGFGMKVLAYDVVQNEPSAVEMGFAYVPLRQLLAESDFVTIHVPLSPQTQHLINAETLGWMKPSAILVNASRGPIVDTAALRDALAAGKIRGAGLDVLEDERTRYHDFADLNVVVTPHIGWYTEEVRRRIVDIALGNVTAWLEGRPVNRVV